MTHSRSNLCLPSIPVGLIRDRRLPMLRVVLAVTVVVTVVSAGFVEAQQRDVRLSIRLARPALLERDAPTANLLKRATEALERRDWKLAIDSLQRILNDPAGGLLKREGRVTAGDAQAPFVVFEWARSRALSMLASMPEEGIDAYRVLHDGKARALLSRAVADGDEEALRTLVDRYLLSSVGQEAAELLAGWHLDRARAVAALELLDRIEVCFPGEAATSPPTAFKRVVAWLMLGDRARALAALDSVAGSTGLSAADRQALERMARLVASNWRTAGGAGRRAAEESWPMTGGDLLRQGRMPAVAPELRENLPWRQSLPSDEPDWWDTHYVQDREEQRGLPVTQAVVADGRVFVKSLRQVVAFDLESLDPVWSSRPPIATAAERRLLWWRNRPRLVPAQGRYSDRARLLYDYIGGSLAVSCGKVFFIEREGGAETGELSRQHRGAAIVRGVSRGTRLVALSAEQGGIVWQRGRSGDPADPLGNVDFLSLPITVGEELWIVYAQESDIYLAALSPESGKLRRKLLLCGVEAIQKERLLHEAVYPAGDGGTVYLSAGVGLVLAVDVPRFALRWATQYPRRAGEERSLEPVNWLCGPPAVSGTLLLAAPTDSDHLLALDRVSGAVRWVHRRPEPAFYILACDEHRVWLGGERVYCLSLDDGSVLWSAPRAERLDVTGRGVLSGSTVYIPTFAGLAAFNAETGARLPSKPRPADQPPLGNLLCLASAMFSVDTNEVRKFPDLTLSYPKVLARHEADPGDKRAAIRLAWMELLREKPQRAFSVLAGIDPSARAGSVPADDVARLRMDALLGMARQPGLEVAQALDYLRQAQRLANSGRDQRRAAMALATRLHEAGQLEEAYLTLWRLGLTSAGDGYVTVERRLRNKARRVIGEVLSRWERELTVRQLGDIAEQSRAVLAEAAAQLGDPAARGGAVARLRQLAELNDAGGAGQAALVALARAERARARFERSEQYFREAIRLDRVARITAEALRDLAEQYLDPRQMFHLEAARLLAELERGYSGLSLPAAGSMGAPTVVADEISRLRQRLDPQWLAAGLFVERARRYELVASPPETIYELTESPPGSRKRLPAVLLDYSPTRPEASGRNVLVYEGADRLVALDQRDGSLLWPTRLRLLGSRPDELEPLDRPPASATRALAFCDGQTAVISGPDGLLAVGLVTGRRLWGVALEGPATADALGQRNRKVAVDGGRLVCVPRRGVLACTSLVDGEDLVWERVLAGEGIDRVLIRDEHCITVGNNGQRATAYEVANGRLLSRVYFQQPGLGEEPIPLLCVSGHLVGPAGEGAIACYNVRSGERAWTIRAGGGLRWLFEPGEGYVGACFRDGAVLLIDVLSGEEGLRASIPLAAKGYAEGVLHEGALLLMSVTRTAKGDEPSLVSIDARRGAVRWRRDGFGVTGAGRHALWRLLHLADKVLPMFRLELVDSANEFTRRTGEIVVEMIDKSTGARVGPQVPLGHAATQAEKLTGAFGLWPERFVIGTNSAVVALKVSGELDEDIRGRTGKGALP